MNKLLELRKKIKKRKPEYIRQEAHKTIRLEDKWRKPKGLHSKMRLHKKGNRASPEVGYGSPKEVRGLHSSGLEMVWIYNPEQLKKVDSKKQGIIIGSTVGLKKKLMIIGKCKESNIKILNMKDVDAFTKKANEDIANKKKAKESAKKEKDDKKKKADKKDEKKELEAKLMTEEEKKEADKKEKDKLLIKKDGL